MKRSAAPVVQFDHFYSYKEIDGFLRALADTFPNLCRIESIGRSLEGRDTHLLTLTDFTSESPEERPGYVIHAGIHAHEVASAHAALHIAKRLLEEHTRDGLLSRVTFFILPRLSPDGSEFCLTTSTRVRSRTDFCNRESNAIYPEDLNGDGQILTVRQEHPDGEFVADPADPRLLVRRNSDSPGPHYRTFPEGYIHDWDGDDRIRIAGFDAFLTHRPDITAGRSFDWNRNWSYGWRPEGEQQGAGDYPFSELAMRQFVEFLHRHPKIFGMVGYHCGHPSVIRPPASGAREELDADDDIALEELAQLGAELTGFPALPLVEMHWARRRDRGKGGHSLDFAYHHLGVLAVEIELGTVMNAAGLTTENYLSWTSQADEDRWMRRLMEWWDSGGQRHPLFEPWQPFEHAQLGRVELGGFLYTVLDNPLLPELPPTLEAAYQFTIAHARSHPWLVVENLHVQRFDDSICRIRLRVANRGDLPTHLTNKGKALRRIRPVRARFSPAHGVTMLSAAQSEQLGHLAAVTGSQIVEWFVSAPSSPGTDAQILGQLHIAGGTGNDIKRTVETPSYTISLE